MAGSGDTGPAANSRALGAPPTRHLTPGDHSSAIFDFRRVNTLLRRKIFIPDVVFRIFVSATKEIQIPKVKPTNVQLILIPNP